MPLLKTLSHSIDIAGIESIESHLAKRREAFLIVNVPTEEIISLHSHSSSRAHCPFYSNLLISFLLNLRCARSSHKSPQAAPLPSPRAIYYRIRQCFASRNLLLGRLPPTSRNSESSATAGGAIAIALKGLAIVTADMGFRIEGEESAMRSSTSEKTKTLHGQAFERKLVEIHWPSVSL